MYYCFNHSYHSYYINDYNIKKSKVNNYVGIPSIGDLFINSSDEYWLYNKANPKNFTSLKKVADNLGVSHYAVQSWIKKANEQRGQGKKKKQRSFHKTS